MQCHEIQEQFVDLLYDEQGTPSAGSELLAHVSSCASCQKELAALKALRTTFKVWRDEPPLRPVTIPQRAPVRRVFRLPIWNVARYAAVAALVTLALLGLSNAQIRWDKSGFSFHTSLFQQSQPAADFYTKDEMKAILNRVLNVSEESNRQMIERMMDTQDAVRAVELRAITHQIKEDRIRN
jgi:hypothetical protein